jgi:hypothetical protein
MSSAPYHRAWSEQLRNQPPETALNSPLLALHTSSDVDPVLPEQITDAREVLKLRDAALAQGAAPDSTPWQQIRQVQRRVVERFLAGRRAHFGPEQCAPLPGSEDLAREGRDVFLVIKYMDEEPHLAATLHSLLSQRGVDPGRLVIVAVDNNSSDGSDRIAQEIAESPGTPVRRNQRMLMMTAVNLIGLPRLWLLLRQQQRKRSSAYVRQRR